METSRRARQEATDSTHRLLETSMEQAGQGSKQGSGQATKSPDGVMRAGPTLAAGMQSVWQEWMRYAQNAVEANARGYSRVLQSTTLPDAVAAQSELMQQEMDLLLTSSRPAARPNSRRSASTTPYRASAPAGADGVTCFREDRTAEEDLTVPRPARAGPRGANAPKG